MGVMEPSRNLITAFKKKIGSIQNYQKYNDEEDSVFLPSSKSPISPYTKKKLSYLGAKLASANDSHFDHSHLSKYLHLGL